MPLCEATNLLSYECQPSLSMVEPVLAFLLQKMESGAGVQKPAVKDVATILTQAIKSCLTDCDDTDLCRVASLLDPRFKDLAFLPEKDHQLVFEQATHIALESIQYSEDSAKQAESNQRKKRRKLSEFEAFLATKQPARVSKEAGVAEEIAH